MKNVQAQLQMLDNYVKEYKFKTNGKLLENEESINIVGNIEFGIINISEDNNSLIGEIELTNKLNIVVEKKVKAEIKITMGGLFKYNNKDEREKFENMLKINGATTLSHFIRTYIHANTAMSGITPIITPMINFVEFFKENEK